MAIVLLLALGVGLGISLGIVGYPILVLTLARRESERARIQADRTTLARTVISPHPLSEMAPPSTDPTVTGGP